jgi:hypothetical protein
MSVLLDLEEIAFELNQVKRKATTLNDELLLFLLDMALLHIKKKCLVERVQVIKSSQFKEVEYLLNREFIN